MPMGDPTFDQLFDGLAPEGPRGPIRTRADAEFAARCVNDTGLLDRYRSLSADDNGAIAEAILAEIRRRNLDL